MSYVKGSQLPSTSTVADTDTLIVTQEGDSKATKKVAKSDLLKEDRTRLTNLETDNTTNKSNITNLQKSLENKAEKTHNHTIADVTNLQTTLDGKAPKIYEHKTISGAIDSKFRTTLIGTSKICGFALPFRKGDNTDTCMPQHGSGIAWGQGDTHGMLCVDYSKSVAYIAGGNGDKLNWNKKLAWKDDLANLQNSLSNVINNKFATMVNVKNYITNSELFTFVDDDHTQYKFKKTGLYRITVTKANDKPYGVSFCDTSLDFETEGNVIVGYNLGTYQPISSSLVMYIDKTKTYEFFGFATGTYQGATTYTKYRGTEFKNNLGGSNILIELIKEC